MDSFGRILLFAGVFISVLGLVFILAPRIPLIGRLPGDISVERDGFSLFVPLATSIVLSVILTIALNIAIRVLGR